MAEPDWFRHEHWNEDIAANFETRLSRARSGRSEYLRIQASILAATRQIEYAATAIELAKRHLDAKPNGIFAAWIYATIAQAYETLGDKSSVVEAYRQAIRCEYARPNVRGNVYIQFAWFATSNSLSELYDEVLDAIQNNKQDGDLVFSVTRYYFFASMAFILDEKGDKDSSKRMAENALEAASICVGPFARHPTVGVMTAERDVHRERLERLAR